MRRGNFAEGGFPGTKYRQLFLFYNELAAFTRENAGSLFTAASNITMDFVYLCSLGNEKYPPPMHTISFFNQTRRVLLLSGLLTLACTLSFAAPGKVRSLSSPDGRLRVDVNLDGSLSYDVFSDGKPVMTGNTLSMDLGDKVLGKDVKLLKATSGTHSGTIKPFIAMKFSTIQDNYNYLTLKFKGNYSVEWRAYDDGIAYRFLTDLGGEIDVRNEDIGVRFPTSVPLVLQECNGFYTSYEEPYSTPTSSEWGASSKLAHLPILAQVGDGVNVFLSESALHDYPGAFFKGGEENALLSSFPKAPLAFSPNSDRSVHITEEAPYIARTQGTRGFPWRYFVITKSDGDLLTTTMACRLAEPSAIDDTSWIHPGQASWEWWNGAAPYGRDVNFRTGCNLDTYKYFIDFASRYGIEYIVMDEGWAKSTRDPFTPNPDVDLHELIRYGKEKNVGIILWLTWLCVENNPTVFETFEKWGVAGIKIDFMDRSDQWMVNFYERTVAEAAKHHLFIDYHGAFKPSGLEYKYPNLLSYEGVRGMEQMGGCTPKNSIYHPFLRNVTGAMEYTPGAMFSTQPEVYISRRPNSASIGTRAYQMALFVVFESGIQMLADNPTLYYRNDECTKFISSVPVLWDETVPLCAKVGEVALVAKRNGEEWYIGGMTAERKEPLTLDITLDFLPEGKTFEMTSFVDGPNSDHQAMDYRKVVTTVKKGDTVKVKMVRNGGFAAVLKSPTPRTYPNTWADYRKYAADNGSLSPKKASEKRIVILGDSITENWARFHPAFFSGTPFIGRGISGQTSYQFLLRFREDVIDLDPDIVVINAATNDIAENNNGPYNEDRTLGNIISMVELARANGIRVVLTSTLPCGGFSWRREITDSGEKIVSLNKRIRSYAEANGIPYVDFHSAMCAPDGLKMRDALSSDGCHPTSEGYDIMERLLVEQINRTSK